MKRRFSLILCVALILALVFSSAAFAADRATKKVILDSDMRPGFDDGAVLVLLAGWHKIWENDKLIQPDGTFVSPNTLPEYYNKIEFLGITVVAGNETLPRGIAHGVRQLEAIKAKDLTINQGSPGTSVARKGIPIYQGNFKPLRPERFSQDGLLSEFLLTGRSTYQGHLAFFTNATYLDNPNRNPWQPWMEFYKSDAGNPPSNGYGRVLPDGPTYPYVHYPDLKDPNGNILYPGQADANGIDNAVDFIVHTINSHPPHTITLLVIGTETNVALALRKDPGIAERAKEIVYMAGSFQTKGNATDAAEANVWFDPEAAKMCMRTAWGDKNSPEYISYGNQIISGLEAAIYLSYVHELPIGSATGPLSKLLRYSQDLWGISRRAVVGDDDYVVGAPDNEQPQAKRGQGPDGMGYGDWFYDEIVSWSNFSRTSTGSAWDVLAAAWIVNPRITARWYSSGDHPTPGTFPTVGTNAGSYTPTGLHVDIETAYGPNYGRGTVFTRAGTNTPPSGTQKAAIQYLTDRGTFWGDVVGRAFVDPDHSKLP